MIELNVYPADEESVEMARENRLFWRLGMPLCLVFVVVATYYLPEIWGVIDAIPWVIG